MYIYTIKVICIAIVLISTAINAMSKHKEVSDEPLRSHHNGFCSINRKVINNNKEYLSFQYVDPSELPMLDFKGICIFNKDDNKHVTGNHIRMIISGGDYRMFTSTVLPNHLSYVSQHNLYYLFGDVFYFLKQCKQRLEWFKVFFINQILNSESFLENSWFAWIDDDLILNQQKSSKANVFDRYIQLYGEKASIIISNDTKAHGDGPAISDFNTGVIIIKKNNVSRTILRQWFDKRPKSLIESVEYDPPTQHGLKLLLDEKSYEVSGELIIAPQRIGDLNINTFHISNSWELNNKKVGLARYNDNAIQHPGIEGDYFKYKFICQTLNATKIDDCPTSINTTVLVCCQQDNSCKMMDITIIDEVINEYVKCHPKGMFIKIADACSYFEKNND